MKMHLLLQSYMHTFVGILSNRIMIWLIRPDLFVRMCVLCGFI